jgi:hypothetical protein
VLVPPLQTRPTSRTATTTTCRSSGRPGTAPAGNAVDGAALRRAPAPCARSGTRRSRDPRQDGQTSAEAGNASAPGCPRSRIIGRNGHESGTPVGRPAVYKIAARPTSERYCAAGMASRCAAVRRRPGPRLHRWLHGRSLAPGSADGFTVSRPGVTRCGLYLRLDRPSASPQTLPFRHSCEKPSTELPTIMIFGGPRTKLVGSGSAVPAWKAAPATTPCR